MNGLPAGAHRGSHRGAAEVRTRRGAGGGLLRGFLPALGPIDGHPLGHRLPVFGRHRTALPHRPGVGRGLRDRGGRSRRPPRGGAPSRGLRRRRGRGPEVLVDLVQRLDLRLRRSISLWRSAIAFALSVMGFPGAVIGPSLDALEGSAEGVQWVPFSSVDGSKPAINGHRKSGHFRRARRASIFTSRHPVFARWSGPWCASSAARTSARARDGAGDRAAP